MKVLLSSILFFCLSHTAICQYHGRCSFCHKMFNDYAVGMAHVCAVHNYGCTYSSPVQTGPSPEELKRMREEKDYKEAGEDANDKGMECYKKRDWNCAIKYFRQALDYDPDYGDAAYNLKKANQEYTRERDETIRKMLVEESAEKIKISESIVDARNVPSGLSKVTDNAINKAYKDAPPGVSERVRKGFQAVVAKDWKVAIAWFQEALKLDPNNKGLQNFIALCGYTFEQEGLNIPHSSKADPYGNLNHTVQLEIDEHFRKWQNGIPNWPISENVRKYISSISLDDYIKRYNLRLPEEKDIMFLFPEKNFPKTANDDPYIHMNGYTRKQIDQYFKDIQKGKNNPPASEMVKKYLKSITPKEYQQKVNMMLPDADDIQYMFPIPHDKFGKPLYLQLPENKDMELLFLDLSPKSKK